GRRSGARVTRRPEALQPEVPQRRGSVIQITFRRGPPRLVFRVTSGEASMKRFCFLAVLIAFSSSAHAGRSISFSVGSHRVHIESSRHCPVSCARMSISRRLDWRRKHDRYDDARDAAAPAKPVPSALQTVPPPAPPAPPVPQTVAPPATTAPAKTIVAAQPAPQVEHVLHQAEDEPSDSPIGDWQTEGKGTVRIVKCGNALCGNALNPSNEKGEAILINMKPKTERQWTGGVYSQDS